MGATHAEKSTVTPGALNAVSSSTGGGSGLSAGTSAGMSVNQTPAMAAPDAIDAQQSPATDVRFCSIDNPDCEACQ
jgi:ribonucleoside-diphosphate reductase alpha chain